MDRTHSLVIATNPALEPTACQGELVEVTTIQDPHWADGRVLSRTVKIWKCPNCDWNVSTSGQLALNHYPTVAYTRLVASLVRRWETGPGRPEEAG